MNKDVFKQYDEYKGSGVEWLGDVPSGWNIVRLKDLGFLQNGISRDGDYFGSGFPFISYGNVYNNTLSLTKIKTFANSTPEDQHAYSCKSGDVFFTRTSETIEEIGFSATCLNTIPKTVFSGFVIRFRPTTNELVAVFSSFYFSAEILRRFFSSEVALVTRASLSQGLLSKLSVVLPPLSEQKNIADYLSTQTAQIDKKLHQLTQKVAHYNKLKQALINETVTHGLDKTVAMKNSGVDWVDTIPANWDVMRLKDVAKMGTGNSLDDTLKEKFSDKTVGHTPYVATKDIDLATYSVNINNGVYIPDSESKYKKAPSYSTLLCVEGGSAGKKMVFVKQSVCYVNKLLCFSNNANVNPLFLHYFIRSTPFVSKFNTCLTGLKDNYWGVTGPQISRFKIPVPSLVEQTDIANYLDKKTVKIDTLLKTFNNQIGKLKELRKTLINDVITGKIKVTLDEREAA
jgi:type I restriction enzyme S subunit